MTAAFALSERDRSAVRDALTSLERDVALTLELGPTATPVTLLAAGGREIDSAAVTRDLLETVHGLAMKHSVTSSSHAPSDGRGDGRGTVSLTVVEHNDPGPWPRTTIGPGLVYQGMPVGYELTTLVHAIVEAGRSASSLAPESLERLAAVDRAVAIDVFVTPT